MTYSTIRYGDRISRVIVRDPAEHIQACWMRGDFYEAHPLGMLPYIRDNYPDGLKYLDVGASVGNHTLFFLGVMQAAHVVAVEPFPPSADHLLANVEWNASQDRLSLFSAAASDKYGTVTVGRYGKTHNVGMVRIMDDGPFSVPAMTIDEMVAGTIDVAKMDVEHYNKPVLEGATRMLDEQAADWFIECENAGELVETDAIMRKHGYERVPGLKFNWTDTYLYRKSND